MDDPGHTHVQVYITVIIIGTRNIEDVRVNPVGTDFNAKWLRIIFVPKTSVYVVRLSGSIIPVYGITHINGKRRRYKFRSLQINGMRCLREGHQSPCQEKW